MDLPKSGAEMDSLNVWGARGAGSGMGWGGMFRRQRLITDSLEKAEQRTEHLMWKQWSGWRRQSGERDGFKSMFSGKRNTNGDLKELQ